VAHAIAARVTSRVPNATLVGLTNAGPPAGAAPSTVDATRLDVACADAAKLFEDVVGVPYDDTDASHHRPASLAVWFVLLSDSGTQADAIELKRKEWEDAGTKLAMTRGGRARILPQTTSELTPSDETPDGIEVRPDFDRQNLSCTFLRAPRSRRTDGLDDGR
jgi:hypothetical protein